MTLVSLERNHTTKASVSIEYAEEASTFEVYVNRSNPADSPGRSSIKTSSSASTDDNEVTDFENVVSVDSKDLDVFRLVENQKWTRVFASVEHKKELAIIPFLASSPAFSAEAQGNFLLHHVCKNRAPLEIVEILVAANPSAVSTPGNCGFLPLHYACDSGSSVEVVQHLLEAYPGAVKVREDKKFRLPLHLAARRCEKTSNAQVLTLLMSYFPDATVVHDGNGKRPIDYAVKFSSPKSRWEAVACLEQGEKLIDTSRKVTARLEAEFDERRKAIEEGFCMYIDSLKEKHDAELARVAGDLLDVEFDRESLIEEMKEGQKQMEDMDKDLHEKLEKVNNRQDRFLVLQEESRLEKVKLEAEHEEVCMAMRAQIEEHEKGETRLLRLVDEKDDEMKVMELQHKAALEEKDRDMKAMEELHQAALAEKQRQMEAKEQQQQEVLEAEQAHFETIYRQRTKLEEELRAQVTSLKKIHTLKDGVIQRVTEMSQTQKKQAEERIDGLIAVTSQQRKQMGELVLKLEAAEQQAVLLKHKLYN